MITLKLIARAAWGYGILAVGVALFALMAFAWAWLALLLSLVLPASTGRRVGRHGAMWTFRIFLGVMEALGAWRLDLHALDALRDQGALIIAPNHPCLLDAALVISRLPNTVCVMKVALLGNFLLGPAARLARYVRTDSLLRLVTRASDELRQGGQLLLFPEGTRSTAQPVGPLTDAVGALSRRTNVPVQAVIIDASSGFLGKGWTLGVRPDLPVVFTVRLGRRFDPPQDVRAFTTELERHFARELSARGAPERSVAGASAVEDAHRLRG